MAKDKKVKKVMKIKEDKKKVTRIAGMEGGSRIKDMSVSDEISSELTTADGTPVKKVKVLKVRGKKYQAAKSLLDPMKKYPITDAVELLTKVNLGKFTGSVEVHLTVLVKNLTGEVNLPHYQGKTKKVVVISDELIDEIKAGKINFDVLLASPADMPKLLPFAKLLGPKGLMPNPKNGTLVPDPTKALAGFSTTALHYKTEKNAPLIHAVIGKTDQKSEELADNFRALIKAIGPKNIKKAVIKSTMSPGIKVSI